VATGAGVVTGCGGAVVVGVDDTGGGAGAGAGPGATRFFTTGAARAGAGRSSARTRKDGAAPSAIRGCSAATGRDGTGVAAGAGPRVAPATSAKQIPNAIAASATESIRVGLPGRTPLTIVGT
jgi:hypothetical protein